MTEADARRLAQSLAGAERRHAENMIRQLPSWREVCIRIGAVIAVGMSAMALYAAVLVWAFGE